MDKISDMEAAAIASGLAELQALLGTHVAINSLELGKNAAAEREFDVLRRLNKSLTQYLERNGSLFYVGVLGHFSAGKSSTINSLLGLWTTPYERDTALNPTDQVITLITREENASSLLGVIKEGHVTIRLQSVDSPLLNEIVLVDTPGTGDPQFLTEVARDFLPICDLIIFLFSAASPLDKSDVPLLDELHKRLPFVPVHFVVTRADELRINSDLPLDESNFDSQKTEGFLSAVVTRVNHLLAPQVYLSSNFSFIDNKSQFRIEQLKRLLEAKCNSSNPQVHVSMHINKLYYYRSSSKALRVFFSGILQKKLDEISKIVETAERNIDKFQKLVQISNSNLTRTWMEHAATIDSAASRATANVRPLAPLPQQYSGFSLISVKRSDLMQQLGHSAKFHAGSVVSDQKTSITGLLQEHLYQVQNSITQIRLGDLSADSNSAIKVPSIPPPGLKEARSGASLHREGRELREAEAEALRESAADLRRSLSALNDQLGQRLPLAVAEQSLEAATTSLKADLDQFFQNIELYRSGVFSHATKESISTLGIGAQLDALETEFTEDDKEGFADTASNDLFPGAREFVESTSEAAIKVSKKSLEISDEARLLRVDHPEDNSAGVVDAIEAAKGTLRSDLQSSLQNEVDRFCSGLSVAFANLIVQAKLHFDSVQELVRRRRIKKYALVTLVTAMCFAGSSLFYHHAGFPSPSTMWGEALLNLSCGLLLELGVLAVTKALENAPKMLAETQDQIHVNLRDDLRRTVEEQLGSLALNSLNEPGIAESLLKIYKVSLDRPAEAWETRANRILATLKDLYAQYNAL